MREITNEDIAKELEKEKAKEEIIDKSLLEARRKKKEAEQVLDYITGVLSSGVILVRIKKPRRKEKWANQGMITSVVINFHHNDIKVAVSYYHGYNINVGKNKSEKRYVPYTDNFFLHELEIVQIYEPPKEETKKDNVEPKEQKDE